MITAEQFNANQYHNGFPFCIERVDIDGFDYWITLGGFKKSDGGTPTDEQIANSRINAMRLYWNLWQVNATVDQSGVSFNQFFVNQDNTVYSSSEEPLNLPPKKRMCEGLYLDRYFSEEFYFIQGYPPLLARFQFPGDSFFGEPPIVAMYLGGNFIGYGCGWYDETLLEVPRIFTRISFGPSSLIEIGLLSYGNNRTGGDFYLDYTNLPVVDETFTIPMLCVVAVTGATTKSVDASNREATATSFDAPEDNTISLDSIQLYTYP